MNLDWVAQALYLGAIIHVPDRLPNRPQLSVLSALRILPLSEAMKISVRVKGEWFAVPVTDAKRQTVKWLGEEALRKYIKLCHNKAGSSQAKVENETFYEIRKAKGRKSFGKKFPCIGN